MKVSASRAAVQRAYTGQISSFYSSGEVGQGGWGSTRIPYKYKYDKNTLGLTMGFQIVWLLLYASKPDFEKRAWGVQK